MCYSAYLDLSPDSCIDPYDACLQALRVTNPVEDHEKARSRARDDQTERVIRGQALGMCQWVPPAIASWRRAVAPAMLLVTGEPGIGKTIAATHIVDVLKQDHAHQKLAYFFCNNNISTRNTAESILCGLLWMFLRADRSLFRHFEKEFKDQGTNFRKSRYTLWPIFEAVALGGSLILIDAFDECDRDSRIFLLHKLKLWAGKIPATNTKIVILSRPDNELEDLELRTRWNSINIVVTPQEIKEDLSSFVNRELDLLVKPPPPAKPRWDSQVADDVKAILSKKTGETFLWVSLALEMLKRVRADKAVQELEKFPQDLNNVYQRIVQEIPEYDQDDARRALHIVLSAKEPLNLDALTVACYIDGRLPDCGRLPSISELESTRAAIKYSKLLRIPPESTANVAIIHQSVRDFVVKLSKDHDWHYGLNEDDAKARIDGICDAYFKCSEIVSAADDAFRLYNALQQATSTQLPIKPSPPGVWIAVARTMELILHNRQAALKFLKHACSRFDLEPQEFNISYQSLKKAALKFLKQACSRLDLKPLEFNNFYPNMKSPHRFDLLRLELLRAAVLFNNLEMVEVLMRFRYFYHRLHPYNLDFAPKALTSITEWMSSDRQSGPNAAKEQCFDRLIRHAKSPIHHYARHGPLWALRRCLELDDIRVGIGDLDSRNNSVFDCILKNSEGRIVLHLRTIMDASPEMLGSRNYRGETPLHSLISSLELHEDQCLEYLDEIIRFLSTHNLLEVMLLQNNEGKTPLHTASELGQRQIARVLATAGNRLTDTDGRQTCFVLQDHLGRTPLSCALSQHQWDVVKILLEPDMASSAVLIVDGKDMMPLHYAALGGNAEVVSCLLRHDPLQKALTSRGFQGKLPLHFAALGRRSAYYWRQLGVSISQGCLDSFNKIRLRSSLPNDGAKDSSTEVLSVLLAADKSGASLSAKDDYGQLAIDLPLTDRNYDAATCILKAGSQMALASLPDMEEAVELQVQNGDEMYPIIDYHRHLKGLQPHIRSWNAEDLICDRCMSYLEKQMPHYHCGLCNEETYDICMDCFDKGRRCKDVTHILRRSVPWHTKRVYESWLRTAWGMLDGRCSEESLENDGQRGKDEKERELLQQYIGKGWFNPDGDVA